MLYESIFHNVWWWMRQRAAHRTSTKQWSGTQKKWNSHGHYNIIISNYKRCGYSTQRPFIDWSSSCLINISCCCCRIIVVYGVVISALLFSCDVASPFYSLCIVHNFIFSSSYFMSAVERVYLNAHIDGHFDWFLFYFIRSCFCRFVFCSFFLFSF